MWLPSSKWQSEKSNLSMCVFFLFVMMKKLQLFDYRSLFPFRTISHFLQRLKQGMTECCKHSGLDALGTLSYAIMGSSIQNLCRHIYIYIYLQFLSFRNIEMGKVALQYIKNGPQGCRLMQIFGPFCSEVCPGKMTEDPLTDEPDCIANNVSATWKWGTFYLHELSLIPACISNHTLRKVWVK